MFTSDIFSHLNRYSSKHKTLYLLSTMLFLWAIFDGSFGYIVPLVITQAGYSKTLMGAILGTSSIFGALLDLVVSRFFHNMHFRRIYFLMYALCALAPALLFKGSPVWMFVAAMALWGFYYDLYSYGNIDFVSRKAHPSEHSQSFGIIWVFRALGYTLAPLIIGAVVGEIVDFRPYLLMWFMLGLSFVLFLVLFYLSFKHRHEYVKEPRLERRRLVPEYVLWEKLGNALLPVLLLGTSFWVLDSFFWTIGPLMSETLHMTNGLGGLFLTLYTVPPVIFGLLVGSITKRFGQKQTAQFSFLAACVILSSFFFVHNPYLILGIVLFASTCVAFSMPALNAFYSDLVEKTPLVEKEIETIQDFFTNVGYIFGPIVAGFLADKVGNIHSFAVVGLVGAITTGSLILLSPKKLSLKETSLN